MSKREAKGFGGRRPAPTNVKNVSGALPTSTSAPLDATNRVSNVKICPLGSTSGFRNRELSNKLRLGVRINIPVTKAGV